MSTRSCALALAIAVAACSSGSGPSGPSGSGVEGTYRGQHRFILTIGGQPVEITCEGSVVVITAAGGQINGSLTIDPCASLDNMGGTTTFAGTITSAGNVTFTVPDQDAIIDDLREQGCEVTRVDSAFTGTVQGGTFDARLTADAVCEPPFGQVQFTWRVDMTRTT